MAFRTECDWSIELRRDGTARHEIQLKLYDLTAALRSSVYQTLSLDLEGVYHTPTARTADGEAIDVEYQAVPGQTYNELSLKLSHLASLATGAQPGVVVISVVQEDAVSGLGPSSATR